jgi:hypothetical protein
MNKDARVLEGRYTTAAGNNNRIHVDGVNKEKDTSDELDITTLANSKRKKSDLCRCKPGHDAATTNWDGAFMSLRE